MADDQKHVLDPIGIGMERRVDKSLYDLTDSLELFAFRHFQQFEQNASVLVNLAPS